jgi:hypothetical protein
MRIEIHADGFVPTADPFIRSFNRSFVHASAGAMRLGLLFLLLLVSRISPCCTNLTGTFSEWKSRGSHLFGGAASINEHLILAAGTDVFNFTHSPNVASFSAFVDVFHTEARVWTSFLLSQRT